MKPIALTIFRYLLTGYGLGSDPARRAAQRGG